MKKIIIFIFFSVITTSVFAKDLGVFGSVFEVKEESMLSFIYKRLDEMKKNGEIDKLQQKMIDDAKRKRDRPNSVLKTWARENTQRIFDPSVTLANDLKDDKGKIIAKKGTIINPLNIMNLTKTLYFIDADDEEQIKWLREQDLKINDKVILTNGSLLFTEKALKRRIYFDQDGLLIKRFKIKALPSVLSGKDNRIIIKEVALHD